MIPDCPLQRRIDDRLLLRSQQQLTRDVTTFKREAGTLTTADGHYLNFAGNDYLGLSQAPSLVRAWQEGLDMYGAGSTASPLVCGHGYPHQVLASSLCDWLGFERALLFNSGFAANQALILALLEKGDLLLQDKLNHASLMEAGMVSAADMRRFRHNDVGHLATLLTPSRRGAALVVTEGVFSMDGDLAPLAEIAAECDKHRAWLVVDDAHGCGVLGAEGKGSCDAAGVKPDILIVTFGKAFGMMGAAVMCSDAVYRYLTQFARHYVYSTAMPPAQAHALTHAVSVIRSEHWRREALVHLSGVFHQTLADRREVRATTSPIKPVIIGDVGKMQAVAEKLRAAGFWVGAIRPPTVPPNTARLRITLSTNHTEEDVRQLALYLRQLLSEVE